MWESQDLILYCQYLKALNMHDVFCMRNSELYPFVVCEHVQAPT